MSETFGYGDQQQPSTNQCLELLGEAVGALAERPVGTAVSVVVSALGMPGWVPFPTRVRLSHAWVAPVTFTLEAQGHSATATVDWPVPWSRVGGEPCQQAPNEVDPVSPGWHNGLYVGGPLAVGHGVRLKPGVHIIPRPVQGGSGVLPKRLFKVLSGQVTEPKYHYDVHAPDWQKAVPDGPWKADIVVSPLLGPDVFGDVTKPETWDSLTWAVLGGKAKRFVDADLIDKMIEQIGLGPADITNDPRPYNRAEESNRGRVIQALLDKYAQALGDPKAFPRRTAASINRLFGADDVMAELVYGQMTRLPVHKDSDNGIPLALNDLARRMTRATQAALRDLAAGRGGVTSVVTRVDEGMTLARVEQSARTCFIGFRGLGQIRGRADLRDLEEGWQGTLCPVQTPESTDTGLVRFTTVGQRNDAPADLLEWFDLSASAALIPFVNHDDPARASIGSKNLKQAVPVEACEPPWVATGWETVLGAAEGAVRAPVSGHVTSTSQDVITIEADSKYIKVSYGAPWLARSGVDNSWTPLVSAGDWVERGQILAHAPDVRVNDDRTQATLSLGVNAVVALTPWKGYNYEDAMVVSESFAARMTSTHIVRVDEDIAPGDSIDWRMIPADISDEPDDVVKGALLFTVRTRKAAQRDVYSPVDGSLFAAFVDPYRSTASLMIRVRQPLAVGDKLTNRHQGKGVVSQILPDDQMPKLPDGTAVEVILNPIGVLRRLNIGQLWETHLGLKTLLSGDHGPHKAKRRLSDEDKRELRDYLAMMKAGNGRMPLTLPDGTRLGGENGVVVGVQYIMKLNHLATSKRSVRGADDATSPLTGQPSQTKRYRELDWIGAAQRLGEMEIWALEAAGAKAVLADAFEARAANADWAQGKPRASLRSVQAHLAVAGLDLAVNETEPRPLTETARGMVHELTPVWRADDLPELPGWRSLAQNVIPRRLYLGEPGQRPAGFETLRDLIEQTAGYGMLYRELGIDGPELRRWRKTDIELAELLDELDQRLENSPKTPSTRVSSSERDDEALVLEVHRKLKPLYDPAEHGYPGSDRAETVRRSIPLPIPVTHPWQTRNTSKLPKITSVPVLPPAYRLQTAVAPQGLDKAYRNLAEALVDREDNLNRIAALPTRIELAKQELDGATPARRAELTRALRSFAKQETELPKQVAAAEARIRTCVRAIIGTPRKPKPDSIFARLQGKRGLLRRALLGQAVVYSGRSVIVPDLTLAPDEIGLPISLGKGIGLPDYWTLGFTLDRDEHPDEDVVILNRQPSLHPYSLVALRAIPRKGEAIRLHPFTLTGLAGDFDGDTVAVHRPTSHEARHEAWQKLSPAARLRSSASGKVLAKMDLDIALGLYLASKGEATQGTVLPAWLPKQTQPLDAQTLAQAVDSLVVRGADPETTMLRLAELERCGLDAATGWSIGALDLFDAPEGTEPPVLLTAMAANVAGGSKAVGQLMHKRGAIPGAHRLTPMVDVPNSYLAGLTCDEYFSTAPGALAGLAEKKLMSPVAGSLTKALVEYVDNVTISGEDCGAPEPESERSPLTCRAGEGVCQVCYGSDPGTGLWPDIDARVGVLAAMLIGERSTQLSMKVFQGGGGKTGALGSELDELYAFFGMKRSVSLDPIFTHDPLAAVPWSLEQNLLVQGDLDDRSVRVATGRALVDRVAGILPAVNRVHIEVIMKHLIDTFVLQHPAPPKESLSPAEFQALVERRVREWEPVIGQKASKVTICDDKSSWGRCHRKSRQLDFNCKLAGRDIRLLDFVIVHELCHFYGRGHDQEWRSRMDMYLPDWRLLRMELIGTLSEFATRRGRSVFEAATSRGNVLLLTQPTGQRVAGVRTRLAVGDES